MELFNDLALGFSVALQFQNILLCLAGCLLGTVIGVLPGIGPALTVARGVRSPHPRAVSRTWPQTPHKE